MERSNPNGQPLTDAREREYAILTGVAAQLSRRDVLKRAVALGLSAPAIAALLAACGGSDKATATKGAAAGNTPATGSGSTPATGSGGTPASTSTSAGGSGSPTAAGSVPTAATASSGGQTGGTLVIGRNIDDLITFDPSVLYEISTAPITWPTYQYMVIQDVKDLNKYIPVLCEEVPTVENGGVSTDGLTYTFNIKKGIKFHTGNELKAADFVFSNRRLHFMKKNPSFLADPFVKIVDPNDSTKDVVGVEAVDDYTVKYTLNEPNVAFLAYMASAPGQPFDSIAAKAQGALDTPDAETQDTKAQAWFDQNSAGVGPYKLTSFKNKEEVVLERFDDYFGEKAAFDKIVFKYIPDSGTALQQLEGGEIDFAMELDSDAIKSLDAAKFDVVEGASLNHTYLAMMIGDTALADILADVNVRQAIAYSIDYDAYVNDLRGGAAVRPASAVPNGMLGADKVQSLAYKQDLEKAKQLITDAGAEGKEITLTFGSGGSYDGVTNETTAAKLQADIEAIGLKVKLNPMEPQQRLDDFRSAKLQFTFSAWGPDYLDVHAYALPFGGVDGQAPSKRIKYVNEENTKLLTDGIKELDPAKREEIYVNIEKNMIADAAFVVLWQPVFQYAVRKGLTGVVVHPGPLTLIDQIKPA